MGARAYVESLAESHIKQAEMALEAIEVPPEHKNVLQEMAYFLIERAH